MNTRFIKLFSVCVIVTGYSLPLRADVIINSGSCVINIIGNNNNINATQFCSAEQKRAAITIADAYISSRKRESESLNSIEFNGNTSTICLNYKLVVENLKQEYSDPLAGAISKDDVEQNKKSLLLGAQSIEEYAQRIFRIDPNARLNPYGSGSSAFTKKTMYLDIYDATDPAQVNAGIKAVANDSADRISEINGLKRIARTDGCAQ